MATRPYKFKVEWKGRVPTLNGRKMTNLCPEFRSREVYRRGTVIVKFDWGGEEDYWGQCKDEWDKWRQIHWRHRHHFARLYKFGRCKSPQGWRAYVVQEYVKQRPGPRSGAKKREAEELFKRFQIGDFHEGNWFVDRKNNVRIVDLGISY